MYSKLGVSDPFDVITACVKINKYINNTKTVSALNSYFLLDFKGNNLLKNMFCPTDKEKFSHEKFRLLFPGETSCNYCAKKPTVRAECFHVSIIRQTLTWTTGSLVHTDVNACNCTQDCMNTIRESAQKVDHERKIPCRLFASRGWISWVMMSGTGCIEQCPLSQLSSIILPTYWRVA